MAEYLRMISAIYINFPQVSTNVNYAATSLAVMLYLN